MHYEIKYYKMNVSATVHRFINIRKSWKTACFNRHAVIIRSHKQRYKSHEDYAPIWDPTWCYN